MEKRETKFVTCSFSIKIYLKKMWHTESLIFKHITYYLPTTGDKSLVIHVITENVLCPNVKWEVGKEWGERRKRGREGG